MSTLYIASSHYGNSGNINETSINNTIPFSNNHSLVYNNVVTPGTKNWINKDAVSELTKNLCADHAMAIALKSLEDMY